MLLLQRPVNENKHPSRYGNLSSTKKRQAQKLGWGSAVASLNVAEFAFHAAVVAIVNVLSSHVPNLQHKKSIHSTDERVRLAHLAPGHKGRQTIAYPISRIAYRISRPKPTFSLPLGHLAQGLAFNLVNKGLPIELGLARH